MIAFHHGLYLEHRRAILPKEQAELTEYKDFPGALRSDVDAILNRPQSRAFVAVHESQPVGYITGHIEEDGRRAEPRRGVVEDWYVDESMRGKGIGAALLTAMLDAFREAGCTYVESTTWPMNHDARRAHEKAGFELAEVKYRRRL